MKFNLAEFQLIKKNLKHKQEVTIVSSSMSPWIKAGESILITPCQPEDLRPFDIIVYWDKQNEILVCHIFKEFRENKIITKPLVKNREDAPIESKFLLGKVIKPQFKWFHKLLLKFNY